MFLIIEADVLLRFGGNGHDMVMLEDLRGASVARSPASPGAIDRIRILPVRH
ncbi:MULTISPECIES: hypothetical protein [unclassified Sphingopyxis]|uniref:hypothetical protein n=1 Tax=unclassified Sphingopyxis TaxID=2614943 RepID=UPI0024ADE54F|nr:MULTISPECIES: hypothetical protein [unclassified Sphingopyxis]